MINAPTIEYVSKTATSITVRHTAPASWTAPSTGWYQTTVYAEGGGQVFDETATTSPELVTFTGLPSDRTYRVYAIAVSDQAEASIPSEQLLVELATVPLADLTSQYTSPALDEGGGSPIMALARFLEAMQFLFHGIDNAEEIAGVGKNVFVEFLPKWYYEDSSQYRSSPGVTTVLLSHEPLFMPSQHQRYNHKVDVIARVEVSHGNRDVASKDAHRLALFLLRRENAVAFEACGWSVREARTSELPSLVGVDDSGRSVFAFKVVLRTVNLS